MANVLRGAVLALVCVNFVVLAPIDAARAEPPTPPKSQLDRAIGRCILSVGAGALIGGLLGSRSRNGTGTGVLAGAAVGGVACAVMVKIARDKDAILQRQQAAIEAGQTQSSDFMGKEGMVSMTTQVRDADVQPASSEGPPRVCRYADTQVQAEGAGAANLPQQLYCRNDQGDWRVADANTTARG